MGCDGHHEHTFEETDTCAYCGHPRSEHNDDVWDEAANAKAINPEEDPR